MIDEDIKYYAKTGALVTLLAKCENLKNFTVTRSMVNDVIAAAEDYLELCDEEEEADT